MNMSDILQKSLAALPGLIGSSFSAAAGSDGSMSMGIQTFVRNLIALNSKHAEAEVIQRELSLQKQKLSLPSLSPAQTRDCLLRLMLCHMLGYDVSFSYIHAIKLAQQGTILEKRDGYLVCSIFIRDSHELAMLLVNTIHRDLNSTNILEVCTALVASCQLVNAELIPALLPTVTDKLGHAKEIVRRKAVLCLRAFLHKVPDLASQVQALICKSLADRDPGVVWAAIEVYRQLAVINIEGCCDVVPAVVDILSQVTSRRLPTLFDYHTVPSPWFTISLLKLLAALAANNQSASALVWPVLSDILQRTEPSHKAGLAVIYETLVTIASIQPNDALLSLATKCIGRFLSSKTVNLKYIGIKVLASIVRVDPRYALEHQVIVMECLEHTDPTIQAKTLDILYHMANTVNKQAICTCIAGHLSKTADHRCRSNIVAKIADIIHRLSDNYEWYIVKMTDLLKMYGDLAPSYCIPQLINVIRDGLVLLPAAAMKDNIENDHRHLFAVNMFWHLLQSSELPIDEGLLRVAVWTLGEYSHSAKHLLPDSVAQCLTNWYTQSHCDQTKQWIISALVKLSLFCTNLTSVLETLSRSSKSSNRKTVQRLHELHVLTSSPLGIQVLKSEKTSVDKMDFTLSFLDRFVSDALEAGAQPYKAHSLLPDKLQDLQVSSGHSFIFEPYEAGSLPPSNHRTLDTSVISPSVASAQSEGEADGGSSGGGLQAKRVRPVWGRDGLLIATGTEEQPATVFTLPRDFSLDNVQAMTQLQAAVVGTDGKNLAAREDKDGQQLSLAVALFSGIEQKAITTSNRLVPVGNLSASNKVWNSLSENNLQASASSSTLPTSHWKLRQSRSMSPDSIDSLHQDEDEQENGLHVPPPPSLLIGQNSLPSRPQMLNIHGSSSCGHETIGGTLHLGNSRGSRLSPDGAQSASLQNGFDDCTMEVVPQWTVDGFKKSTVASATATAADCDGTYYNIKSNDLCDEMLAPAESAPSNGNIQLVGKITGGNEDSDLELELERNDIYVSRDEPSLLQVGLDDSVELFSCRQFSVTYSKIFANDCLQIVLHMKCHQQTDCSIFTEASVAIISDDCSPIKIVATGNVADGGVISLQSLSHDVSMASQLCIYPPSDTSQCRAICPITLRLSVPLTSLDVIDWHIDVCVLDFVRPYELSVDLFAEAWAACDEEIQVSVQTVGRDIGDIVALLRAACHLHLIQIVDSEAILSGCLLDWKQDCILLHCELPSRNGSNQTASFWAKSCGKDFLVQLVDDIVHDIQKKLHCP